MAISMFGMTGCGDKSSETDNEYKWWIYDDDGQGTFYGNYQDNPAVEWLNQQYWDSENGGLGTKENGTALKFSFQTPITGAEEDNFNTIYEDGVLIELTDYVDKYMPNLKKLMEEDASIRSKAVTYDEKRNIH